MIKPQGHASSTPDPAQASHSPRLSVSMLKVFQMEKLRQWGKVLPSRKDHPTAHTPPGPPMDEPSGAPQSSFALHQPPPSLPGLGAVEQRRGNNGIP